MYYYSVGHTISQCGRGKIGVERCILSVRVQ
jgi:hypothetical protein